MKILRTEEDVLSLKDGDEVLAIHKDVKRLVTCVFKCPPLNDTFETYGVGLYLKQDLSYYLIAPDIQMLAIYLDDIFYNLQLYNIEE